MTEIEKFIIARWMYSIGEPIIDDAEYQLLLETIMVKYPDSEYVKRTWSDDPCPVDLLCKYGYSNAVRDIVLSDKSESIPSIGDWNVLKSVYSDCKEEMTLSMKHDGWNIQADYYNKELVNIQTRGRARDAVSAEVLRSKIPNKIGWNGKYKVCMEATVNNDNYSVLKKELGAKSQRGAVSSCLARGEYTSMIDLHAFSIMGESQTINPFPILEEWGFSVPRWCIVHNYDELLEAMNTLDKEYCGYQSPTDGLVVRGEFTRAIRLLSWEEPVYHSYVIGYDESFGLHRIGVKAKIYPIKLRNSTQSLVSVTNYQRVIDNNLRPGYPIAFRLAAMSIADLDEVSTRLLQEKWEDNLDGYRAQVEENEAIKKAI